MCNQHRISDKFQKLRQDRLDVRTVHHHLVGDRRKLRDLKRDRTLRIHKCTERIHDLTILYFYSPDLYDPVFDRAESGCLQVKYNIGSIQTFCSCSHCDLRQIVHHISLYAVNDLKRVVLVQPLDIVIGVRKCLSSSMVCHGDRRMSPVMCAPHDVLHFRHAVHVAHLRMAMQFHTFQRT